MRRILACTLVAAVAPSAFAGITISGSSGASWQAFPTSLNVYGTTPRPYWDQNTKDTTGGGPTNRNVGNYLNGTWTGALPAVPRLRPFRRPPGGAVMSRAASKPRRTLMCPSRWAAPAPRWRPR